MNQFAGIAWVFLFFTALLPFGCSSSEAGQDADMVLFNGKIVTVDDSNSEVRALAVRGDRIVALGSDADIKKFIGKKTRVIDLEGRLAIPGFNEGHGHFMGIGNAKMILDLTKAKNWDEIVAMVAEAAKTAKPGEWITGRGWHQDKWDRVPEPSFEKLPIHDGLSKVSPENPVILTHASGHGSFVNARAMELAGIDSKTKDPP